MTSVTPSAAIPGTPPESVAPPRARSRGRRKPTIRGVLQDVDAVRACAVGLILVALTAVHFYLGPLKHTRPSLTLLILAFGIMALQPKTVRWRNLIAAWPSKLVLGLVVCAVGSAAFGISPGGSVRYIIDLYWKVLVFFVVLTVAVRNVRDVALLIWTFVISILILAVLALTVLEMDVTREGLARLSGQGVFDANDIGMLALMGIPMALLTFFNSRAIGKTLSILALAGAAVTIALTGSRGAMVGLVVMAPWLFASLKRIPLTKRLSVVGIVVAGLVVAAPAGYWKQMETIFDTESNYNYSTDYGRLAIAKRGLGYMLRYPIFGLGIANFPRAEGTISPIAARRAMAGMSVEWIAPHNTYVQVGAELGAPALLIWLGMLWGGVFGLRRLGAKLPRTWEYDSGERRLLRDACLFLPLTFIAFAVTSFFLTHAYTTPIYIVLAIVTGVVVQARRELRRDASAARAAAVAAGGTARAVRRS